MIQLRALPKSVALITMAESLERSERTYKNTKLIAPAGEGKDADGREPPERSFL